MLLPNKSLWGRRDKELGSFGNEFKVGREKDAFFVAGW